MVILIGGASCTGKTLMAQRLLEKYKIPYLSVDHIKMGLIRGSQYCDFTADYDDDDVIAARLWPILKGIIMTNIENGQHIIIEGCYLLPEHIFGLEHEYQQQVIAVWIGFSEQYIVTQYELGIMGHRCEIEHRGEDDEYTSRVSLIRMHAQLKERCMCHNAVFFELASDYVTGMERVYQWLDRQVTALKHST